VAVSSTEEGLTIGAGQLKAKLAKLKRELLTPTSGGGGGGGESRLHTWHEQRVNG
jgi:hypothetical protein